MTEQKFEKVVEGEGELLFISICSLIVMSIYWDNSFFRGFLMGLSIMSGLFYWKSRKVYWRKIK